ncbi:hypothetical protein EV421DRAFT_2039769 [Armillaria borealis]|uniref:NmrA-like domain-containing protein n=1 Tax=Armillaria borealis TaxID=47425 RepID=A0AA39J2R8_9AGAR|nr:hypothetical protein EV421DRAFT_2039769 [Armillaria borealis]
MASTNTSTLISARPIIGIRHSGEHGCIHVVVNALKDAYAVFGLTNSLTTLATIGPEESSNAEINQGKNVANAAASTSTLQHFIWSTLSHTHSFTIPHFDSKAAVDECILTTLPSLAPKSIFFYAGYYVSNLLELLPPVKDKIIW